MPDIVRSPLIVDPALLAGGIGLDDTPFVDQQEIPTEGSSGSSAEWHGDEYATASWADIDNEAHSFCMYGHPREEGATIHDQNSQDLQDLFGLHMLNPDSAIEQQMVHDEELQGTPQREDQWYLESIDENGPEPAFIQDVKALQCPDTSIESKKKALIVIFDSILKYRYRDGDRTFPPVDFYIHLTHNEEDVNDIQPLVRRCAEYFYMASRETADDTIETLTLLRQAIVPPSPQPELESKAQIDESRQIQSGHLQASESQSTSSQATKTSKKAPRTTKASARVIDHQIPPLMREVNKCRDAFKYPRQPRTQRKVRRDPLSDPPF